MSCIDDLKSGRIALVDAITKLEEAQVLVNRFLIYAEPQDENAAAVMTDAVWIEKELKSVLENAADAGKEYADILDAVECANLIRRRAHG